mmetsp:Transcript_16648/g.48577  ORF Transcript_16648/g.48577 Transcript_16648/m.48577 type:complete len:201 (+) Transcript_16648:238-840(+)
MLNVDSMAAMNGGLSDVRNLDMLSTVSGLLSRRRSLSTRSGTSTVELPLAIAARSPLSNPARELRPLRLPSRPGGLPEYFDEDAGEKGNAGVDPGADLEKSPERSDSMPSPGALLDPGNSGGGSSSSSSGSNGRSSSPSTSSSGHTCRPDSASSSSALESTFSLLEASTSRAKAARLKPRCMSCRARSGRPNRRRPRALW